MSLKRKLTQNDLRKAMSDHKKKAGIVKRIESPLAKYNELGQLHCILCKSQVKSEAVWPVHLNSKQHRENLAIAKQGKEELEKKIAQKRVAPPTNDAANQDTPPKKIKGILKNSSSTAPPVSKLPDDFFDKPNNLASRLPPTIVKSSQPEEIVEEAAPVDVNKGKDQTHLPEGFFDDPIMDAKARNVEYKDPIEEEWDKFQKEIKEETAQSAQIIADDQEEATAERQLDEIDEQIRHWSRVMDLAKRKDQLQATDRKQEAMDDDDISSGEEENLDEFLDWRAKHSYK